MNSAPLLLMPLAAVALLSSQPSREPVAGQSEADQISAILNHPEVRALIEQLQQAASTLDLQDEEDRGAYSGRRHSRKHAREIGLHTGHLARADSAESDGYFSPARGLTPEDEWQQMFPRYALKLAAAR